MTYHSSSTDRLLNIYLTLGQYPTLANRIRIRMRRELFERGVITPQAFEVEVREKAILSQEREGIHNPFIDEPVTVWETRLAAIRDQLTDYYFSQHLTYELFEKLVKDILGEHGVTQRDLILSINPELAPQELVFEQALMIEHLPSSDRAQYEPRLRELKVVLIRNMISDQLRYINIAREWFTAMDLADIRRHMIGSGRIGGKAAGMLLAACILKQVADEPLRSSIITPESWYLGSDFFYTFISINNLVHWNDQKYKDEEEMRSDYPTIQKDFAQGEFPPEVLEKLQSLLASVGSQPLIVRSSSMLEDNFGTSFAGKYESIFLPNQGSPDQNLDQLTQAIATIFGSTLNPGALMYRRSKGLQDYDERMAILIQVVQGEKFGKYYLPQAAGVAFSHNQYRWAPQIQREFGFARLVWGLGTRAVDRVGNDYPRLVALSHPTLRPSVTAQSIRRYSQQFVDLIDLEANQLRTLPIHEVLNSSYPPLRFFAQLDQDGYFSSLRSNLIEGDTRRLILTFEDFLRRTPFAERLRTMLQLLEKYYRSPVDTEFTAQITRLDTARPEIVISLIQCRPQSHLVDKEQLPLPTGISLADTIFSSTFMIPQGHIQGIRYVLYVRPEAYFTIPTPAERFELERAIGKLNTALAGEIFICVGPGRWGTTNPDLGVHVDYSDIYNTKALVELTGAGIGIAPEPSLGTHFFQDLLEGQIYPLAINLDEKDTYFNDTFFKKLPNRLSNWLTTGESTSDSLYVLDVEDFRPGHRINLIMDEAKGQAMAYLVKGKK
jgi:hypothetical protein